MTNFFGNGFAWCKNKPLNEKSTTEVINEIDDIILAIEMKILNNKYKQEEHLRKAQQHQKRNEKEEMMSEMRKKYDKNVQCTKWVFILEQVSKVRNDVEQSSSMESIVNMYKDANNILQLALTKITPDEVHDIMENLEHNSNELNEINKILCDNSQFQFDENSALNEIEEQNNEDSKLSFISIPNVILPTPTPNTRIAIAN
jgi:hypothetical protein